jgi:hypothetical protein
MASDEMPDVDVPDGFEVGTIDDAIADEDDTYRKKIVDEDAKTVYWFDLKGDVPMRKKDQVLENNLTTEKGPDGEPQQNLSTDYYYDLLDYMVVDWFGAYEADAPSLRVFFNKMSTVFEELRDEVPPPFEDLTEAERGK